MMKNYSQEAKGHILTVLDFRFAEILLGGKKIFFLRKTVKFVKSFVLA